MLGRLFEDMKTWSNGKLALVMGVSACWMHPFWVYAFSTKVGASRARTHASLPPPPAEPKGPPDLTPPDPT